MKQHVPERLERGRVTTGPLASVPQNAFSGMFRVPGPCGRDLRIVSGPGFGWEHVSVSLNNRCPNWPEMNFVKDLFWDEEEAVVQFHPPRSQYVNCHPYCLHLWKPIGLEIPLPPSIMVGPRTGAPS